ncbi:MAG: Glutamyl-tRNA reductase [Gammaproteobacteria bacterium]|nr:Glutamyl-tRNA reductase [Gammaproteobacteria bacterium]
MHLLALGLNHNSAPVDIRERAAVTAERLEDALESIRRQGSIREATILSTCNRTEIYCHQEEASPQRAIQWLCEYHDLSSSSIRPYLYQHPDRYAVSHAFRVAAGLDSMMLGEPQILGQMKDAFTAAQTLGTTGKILNRLFQQTFTVAKQIRSDTEIGANAVSIAYAAVSLARNIFADLSRKTVLMIGAGETIELTARHFTNAGVRRLIVANRTRERARELGALFGAEAMSLAQLPERLGEADIVISSTASTLPILGKGTIEHVLKQRKHKPMFMVDLAVPRDIEPQVGELSDVYLYAIDDLRGVVEENLETRKAAARDAEKIIDSQTRDFMRWLRGLNAVPTIRDLHEHLNAISSEEIDKATRRLNAGDDPEQVVRNLARTLSRKFAHEPVAGMNRDASGQLADAVRRLFKLERTDDS